MDASDFSVFEYLYRDSGNYKAWGELLLRGNLTDREIEQMREKFSAGEYFIAEQLGVPSVAEQLWGTDGSPNESDHTWHEFSAVRNATDQDVNTMPVWGGAKLLLERIVSVKRWDETLSCNWPHG
ncbi:hypothetical protein GPA22_02640 [Aromatoleum toluvorans]|uniref:Uncharacterized protein n=1 Tax=Aromatoleum toluvorans TaxID=92002 RepID=A0ABX1PT53_9RHOO|nr:hypothetical protein [Aromatoleum toluvorans]NMG42631.1 hypothetical protein [Aromatoleum toluvorans]